MITLSADQQRILMMKNHSSYRVSPDPARETKRSRRLFDPPPQFAERLKHVVPTGFAAKPELRLGIEGVSDAMVPKTPAQTDRLNETAIAGKAHLRLIEVHVADLKSILEGMSQDKTRSSSLRKLPGSSKSWIPRSRSRQGQDGLKSQDGLESVLSCANLGPEKWSVLDRCQDRVYLETSLVTVRTLQYGVADLVTLWPLLPYNSSTALPTWSPCGPSYLTVRRCHHPVAPPTLQYGVADFITLWPLGIYV